MEQGKRKMKNRMLETEGEHNISPEQSLVFARLQGELDICATYYFRIVPESFDPRVIEQISALGHEIGYHYEDLSIVAKEMGKRADKSRKTKVVREKEMGEKEIGDRRPESGDRKRRSGKGRREKGRAGRRPESGDRKSVEYENELFERGILSFEKNLARLRQVADVKTICMHGSPLSKWDSRLLWDRYDYRDFGIIGEPYFDVDFENVAYYTDTGRRWDGEAVSIRDKAMRQETGVGKRT